MTYEDLIATARVVRKYISAVESTLYWNMSTRQTKDEIAEATRIAELLEDEAAAESTEVK